MQERQVTVDGETRRLPDPFLVLATQNPIELEGTFPLPEAQVDRFLMRISIGYPSKEEEREILRRFRTSDPLESLKSVVTVAEIRTAIAATRQVTLHEVVEDYLLDVVRATRQHQDISLGVSPRGSLALYHTARALAAIRGRDFVVPDDVKDLITPVLAHRLVLRPETRLRSRSIDEVLAEIVEQVPVPVEEVWQT